MRTDFQIEALARGGDGVLIGRFKGSIGRVPKRNTGRR